MYKFFVILNIYGWTDILLYYIFQLQQIHLDIFYLIVSISFIYTNHTKWKSCYESHIDVDVEKFKLWGNFKNAIFMIKKNKVF